MIEDCRSCYEFLENGILFEDWSATRHDHLLPCPRDGYIEFAVDDVAIFLETIGSKEVELIAMLDCKRIDDDVTLAALIALHGVDADLFEAGDAEFFYLFSNHGNLIAIGNDDTHGLIGIKTRAIETVDAS